MDTCELKVELISGLTQSCRLWVWSQFQLGECQSWWCSFSVSRGDKVSTASLSWGLQHGEFWLWVGSRVCCKHLPHLMSEKWHFQLLHHPKLCMMWALRFTCARKSQSHVQWRSRDKWQMIRNKTDPKIFKCFEDFGPFSSHTNHININNINKRVIFTVTSSHYTKHNHTITHSSGGSILSTRRWNGDEETLFKLQTGGHSQTCCWNEWVFYSLRVVATDRQSASRAVSCRA